MIRTFALISLLTMSSISLATKPCSLQTKAWFMENVAASSDLVAFVSVLEDSHDQQPRWTKVKIIEKLIDKSNYNSSDLTIENWQADQPPLFEYKKGAEIIVWLRKDAKGYSLTNDNWGFCVPAIWPVEKQSQLAMPVYQGDGQILSMPIANIKTLK